MTKQGKNDGLMSFEQAKKIKLWHEPFQVVGVVTNTMKLQRHIAKEKFKKEIEELYKKSWNMFNLFKYHLCISDYFHKIVNN